MHWQPSPLLLPSQRRELFESIRESSFDPRQFRLSDDGAMDADGQVAEVLHEPTGYKFRLRRDFTESEWRADLFPALETRVGTTRVGSWNELIRPAFATWLGFLDRELDAGEDPWEQIRRERNTLAAEPDAIENTPFEAAERAQISAQLREIKEYIRATDDLSEAQARALEGRVEYLDEAAGRMGRVDWRNAFVGVMLGLVVEAIAPPELVREVLMLAMRGLASLFGGDIPELPQG